MKPLFCLVSGVALLSLLVCCKKKAFKSGVGLYSVKQYHCSKVSTPGDTVAYPVAQISTISMDNNYLSWNGITFHTNGAATDTLVTYINDSVVSGNYTILYTLQYWPKKDLVKVVNPTAIINNNITTIWVSF